MTFTTSTKNVISSSNSSNSTLSSTSTFTGSSEDVSSYHTVSVMIETDVKSAEDGLTLEYSQNGTIWLISEKYTFYGCAICSSVKGRYLRVSIKMALKTKLIFV